MAGDTAEQSVSQQGLRANRKVHPSFFYLVLWDVGGAAWMAVARGRSSQFCHLFHLFLTSKDGTNNRR